MREEEPHEVLPGVLLGSRRALLHKWRELKEERGVTHVLMCCDRAPDLPRHFTYLQLEVNNESRDSAYQHAQHVHEEEEEHECASHGAGACRDLHLMARDAEHGVLAVRLARWVDAARPGAVLVHGYDGVSNSAAVALAYVMWKLRVGFSEAYERLAATRPTLNLGARLERDLRNFDARLQLEGHQVRIVPRRKR